MDLLSGAEAVNTKHEYTPAPVCPHCGHVMRDAWELPIDGPEGECEADCGECDKPFIVSRQITVYYSTQTAPKKDNDFYSALAEPTK